MPTGVGRWALLSSAVLQVLAPVVISFSGDGEGPPVVPAGYAFIIWSPIVLGCLTSAVYGWPLRRAELAAYRAVHGRLTAVQVLFVAWLLAAVSPQVWLTVPIFAGMLVLTVQALERVLASTSTSEPTERTIRWLLGGTLGLYAGWSTAAVWVNVASLLPAAGLSPDGVAGTAWQTGILAAAAATALIVIRRAGAAPAYVAAVAWALVGVVISGVMVDRPGVSVAAGAGLLTVLTAAITDARRGMRRTDQIRPGRA